MLMNDQIRDIVNVLDYIPDDYGIYIEDESIISTSIISCNNAKKYKIDIRNGITKAVLIPEGSATVIKIPFRGCWEYGSEIYDYEKEEYTGEYEEDYFEEYTQADDIDGCVDWNYCENELRRYNKAVTDGFGEFFLSTECCQNERNLSIYLQEKAVCFCDVRATKTNESAYSEDVKDTYKSHRELHAFPSQWIMDAIIYYGAEKVLNFINYLKKEGFSSDWHCGNVGYKQNGAPCLLDWSGYREEF